MRSFLIKSTLTPHTALQLRIFLVKATGQSLEKVVRDALRKAAPEETPILAWPLACGSSVAARTRALEYADGVLRVQVSDHDWKKELENLAPRYVAILARYTARKVERIEFVIAAARIGPRTQAQPDAARKKAKR